MSIQQGKHEQERLLSSSETATGSNDDAISNANKKNYFRRAALLSVVDFLAISALWLAAGYPNSSTVDGTSSGKGEGGYVVSSVMNYSFKSSLFDVVLISLFRALATISFYANVSTLFSPKKNGSTILVQILAIGTPISSLAFLIIKTVLSAETIFSNHGSYTVSSTTAGSWVINTSLAFDIAVLAVSYLVSLLDLLLFFTSRAEFISSDEYAQLLNRIDDDADVEKHDEKKLKHSSIGRLSKLALPEKWLLLWGMVNLVIAAISSLAMPLFFGEILGATSRQELNTAAINLNIVFIVGSVASFFRAWLFTLAGQRLVARLRIDLFKAVSIQEIAFFDTTRTGELTNRLSSDTQVIQNTVTVNISMVVRYIIQIIGAIILLFITSWSLTLIMLSVVPVVAVGAVIYGRYLKKLGSQFQDELAKAASTAEESISNMRTVRSFSREKKVQLQYERDVNRSLDIGKKNALVQGGFTGMLSFVAQGAIGLVVYEGAVQVLAGTMAIATLTAFVLYTLTIAMAMAFIASLFGDFMTSVGASERIFELLDKKPGIQVEGGRTMPEVTGILELNNVVFRYPSRPDSLILENVSLSLEPGHVVALVGPSGGGKSTIVSLIERFYDPIEGTVTLDKHDIRDLDPIWYRRQIGFVSQEPVLFACSIKDNIAYGVEGTTQEQVEEAAKQANAHEFIQTFEEKYETVVGERGVRLSGGQKQRIAIARALLMNPRILLLDEATSALDAESEHLVQEAIDRAMVNRTVLVIAHRLSTVRSASKVIVITGGGIAESGTHDELIAAGGIYKKLVKRQLQK